MKYIIIILYLLTSFSSPYLNSQGKQTLDIKFFVNGKIQLKNSLNRYIVYENDICKIEVKGPNKYLRLEKIDEADLKQPVNFGEYATLTEKEKCIFVLTGLEPNKMYSYLIKEINPPKSNPNEISNTLTYTKSYSYDSLNYKVLKYEIDTTFKNEVSFMPGNPDTNTLGDFYVEVHEITHIEAGIGPVFSNMEFNNFILVPAAGDTTGAKVIKNIGTKNQIDFVLGAVIRPWGYDERGDFSFRNTFLYFGLGVNNKSNIFEKIYLGLGCGYRGFNIVAGANLASVKQLIEGYSLQAVYKNNDIENVDDIVTSKVKINFFAGLLIDLGIFGNVFSKVW